MPELPEVETIRRDLQRHAVGRRIEDFIIRWPRTFVGTAAAAAKLRGKEIERIDRRGKYLLLRLSGGTTLSLHLRMSGRLRAAPAATAVLDHERARVLLDDGAAIVFTDPRKFGRIAPLSSAAASRLDASLGIEPLDPGFSATALRRSLAGTRRAVKSVLLDQARIAGIGNIYADEALHAAGIHPAAPAGALSEEEIARLAAAIPTVLSAAIRHRGTTFQMYRDGQGKKGRYAYRLMVYGRGGLPCRRCGTELSSTRLGQRTTVWCSSCQPRSAARRSQAPSRPAAKAPRSRRPGHSKS